MRSFLLITLAVLVAIGIGVASVRPPPSPVALRSGRTLHLRAAGPCARSIAGYTDVSNSSWSPPSQLSGELLPGGAGFGHICEYSGPGLRLVHTALFSGRGAVAFEKAISALRTSTSPPAGVFHCPNAVPRVAILALGYTSDTEVDLWYADSGCRTLDNGSRTAYEVADPAFDDTFAAMVTRYTPPADRPF